MRTLSFLSMALFFVMLAGVSIAQPRNNPKMRGVNKQGIEQKGRLAHADAMVPNLTEEQKTKIKDLRLAHYKVVQPLHNQMGELKAKQRSLSTAEKTDLKAINANIDDITKVQNQLMKAIAAHQQDIRSLLTEEQKIKFDSKQGKKDGRWMKHGMRGPFASNEVSPAPAI